MHQLTSTRLAGKCHRIALLSLVMLLVTAAGSHAGTLISQTAIYDVFVTDPTPVGTGVESLYSTMLYVVNTTGNAGHDPMGFDGVFFGYSGFSGSLHQHDDPILGVYTPTADSSLFATAIDTHFLNTLAELVVVTAPFETRNVAPSAEPSDSPPLLGPDAETRFGDRLSGTFALAGGAAGPTWQIAQLVASSGMTITLDFAISGILEPGPAGDVQTSLLVPEPATLVVDIKPGSDPNSVNLKSKGLLPVVVYGSEGLDLTEVDLDTLLLNGVGPRVKPDGSWHVSFEDVDGDLLLDLVMHFEMQALGIEPGMTELALTGAMMDGTELQGADAIRIVPDFNGDLMVNATDLAIMKTWYGTWPRQWVHGDANCDDIVDATDLAILKTNFGFEAPMGAVPGPATLSLLALGGLALLRRRKRKPAYAGGQLRAGVIC